LPPPASSRCLRAPSNAAAMSWCWQAMLPVSRRQWPWCRCAGLCTRRSDGKN